MKPATLLTLALTWAAAALPAQTVDTLGGTGSAPTGTAIAKANMFNVDSSVLLINLEMFLDVPGPEMLTFFAYRHHSRVGTANLEFSTTVSVNGTGAGPAWYSAGPIAWPLLCGHTYLIGAYWPGSATYYYTTSSGGQPVSFGTWQRGNTLRSPPPQSTPFVSGVDIAQYHQRLTTLPINALRCIATNCIGPALSQPRLLGTDLPTLGTQLSLDIRDGAASAPAAYLVTLGPVLTAPVTMFGCTTWLDLTRGATSQFTVLSSGGVGSLPLTIPGSSAFTGVQLSVQAGVLGANVSITNALQLTIN